MKKLITTAMALALAAGFAVAQVTSDNIVGYNKIALPTRQQIIIGNGFQAVGGGPISLQDILVEGVPADGGTVIWWWNKDTSRYTKAHWVELDFDPDNLGWGDPQNWLPITKSFAAGEGFWIQAPAGATVNFANPFYVAP